MRHLLCSLLFAATAAHAQDAVYSNEPSGQYLRTWELAGPFDAGAPAAEAPDLVHLSGFGTDHLAEGDVAWTLHTSDDDAIDLDATVSDRENVIAYAACTLEMDATKTAVLALGSNDGVEVWLNDATIWDYPQARGLKKDEDLIPLVLREGRNRLMLKVEERGNVWEFAARLLPMDHPLLREKLDLFEVVSSGSDQPIIRFKHNRNFLEQLRVALDAQKMQGVRFRVAASSRPNETLWTREWKGEPSLTLDLPTEHYERYTLAASGSFPGGLSLESTLPFSAGQRVEHALFENGASTYRIVVAENASESELWAATELQHALNEIGGVTLEITNDLKTPSPVIVLGYNDRARDLLNGEHAPTGDQDESFVWTNVGTDIVIAGGAARGTMYGVMDFLEDQLGARWYTPAVTVMPQKDRFAFTRLYHTESPGIRVRNDFYFEAFDPIWAAHNRGNGVMGLREQHGGVEGYWAVHTFFPLMPPEEFFADHPEYYSLINGERRWERAQLCLTNPDVKRILIERLMQRMRDNPGYLIYSLSQNDWHGACQCDNCQAIAKREDSESGPVLELVNEAADAAAKEFPDKFVGTLAYQYTRKPPKNIKPRENVVIRFCSIECCFAHSFTECPTNADFMDDLNGWAAVAPHMYVWDYVVNFSHYIMPYPNFRVLKANIQTLRDHKAIGIMEQGAYQSRGGEFAELRAYLLSKLLWDPECDVEAVINDFMYGYYGRAGQYVRAYFDLLHNRITPDTHIGLGLRPTDKIFSDEFVRDAGALFDQAERVADNTEILHRVEMARLPILYLKCKRTPLLAKEDGDYERFNTIVQREGITHYAESGAPHREAFHQEVEQAK